MNIKKALDCSLQTPRLELCEKPDTNKVRDAATLKNQNKETDYTPKDQGMTAIVLTWHMSPEK